MTKNKQITSSLDSQSGFTHVLLAIAVVLAIGTVGSIVALRRSHHYQQVKQTTTGTVTTSTKFNAKNNTVSQSPSSSSSTTTSTTQSKINSTAVSSPNPPPNSISGVTGHTYLTIAAGANCKPQQCQSSRSPYQATVQVNTSDGSRIVTTFTTDVQGYFSVNLDTGDYLLVPQASSGYEVSNQNVTVKLSQYTTADINYYGLAP